MFQLQDMASLFPLCLIHVDSFTENVKLTSAPFSDFAPRGGGSVDRDSDTPRTSPWPLSASVHVMKIHELPLSLKVSRIFQFLYVNNFQRKAARESGGRGHSHTLCGREQGSAPTRDRASPTAGPAQAPFWVLAALCVQDALHERDRQYLLALPYPATSPR